MRDAAKCRPPAASHSFPWHWLLAWFVASLTVWILSGFLRRDISLTLLLFPVVLAVAGALWLHSLTFGPGIVIPRPERPLALAAVTLTLATLLGWAASNALLQLPLKARIFNLILPLGVAALHLTVWTSRLDRVAVRRLLVAFFVALTINDVVSGVTFLVFNWAQLLPVELFYLNPRYPVILFHAAGRGLVRTPGVFETGGSNGTFMLIMAVPLLSWLLFSRSRSRRRPLLWSLFALQVVLIAATLTRRSALALAAAVAVLLVWHARETMRLRFVVVMSALGALGASAVMIRAPELVTLDTVLIRLSHWQANVSDIFATRPIHVLTGFGVLQSSLNMIPGNTFRILDNTLLELLMYGGLPLLLAVSTYYLIILLVNGRLTRRVPPDWQWLPIGTCALVVAIAIISLFTPFLYSVTESIPACLAVNLATKFSLQMARNDSAPLPEGRPA